MESHILQEKQCQACSSGTEPLSDEKILVYLQDLKDWTLNEGQTEIHRVFLLKNYARTMALVNAIAYLAHQQGHHPDLEVSYNRCVVRLTTHAIQGLSENDFIFAAKVNALVQLCA